ncbi:MAG: hypothetical protein AABY22_03075, partial [Nanoarchaeota archaeon]
VGEISNQIGRQYFDKIDEAEEHAAMEINEYINDSAFDHGGKIRNQYEGKTAEKIWNEWLNDQRIHFLIDHATEMRPEIKGDITKLSMISYVDLPHIVKGSLSVHISEGQYAHGGHIPSTNYYYLKIGNIIKEVKYNNFLQIVGYEKNGIKVIVHSEIKSREKQSEWTLHFNELIQMMDDKKFVIEGIQYETDRDKILLQIEIEQIKQNILLQSQQSKINTLTAEKNVVKTEANALMEGLEKTKKSSKATIEAMGAMMSSETEKKWNGLSEKERYKILLKTPGKWSKKYSFQNYKELTPAIQDEVNEFYNHNLAEGGKVADGILPSEYYKEFKLKGNAKSRYNIFQSHNSNQLRQAVKQIFPKMAKTEHEVLFEKYKNLENKAQEKYNSFLNKSFEEKFGREYHASDYKVSGIVRDEFSDEVKNELRKF